MRRCTCNSGSGPPWWQFPPLDLITENIIPFKIRDIRRYTYAMQRAQAARTGDVLQRGNGFREQGKLIPGTSRRQPAPAPAVAVPPGTPTTPAAIAPAPMPPVP